MQSQPDPVAGGGEFRQAARQANIDLVPVLIEPPYSHDDYRRAFLVIKDAKSQAMIVTPAAVNFASRTQIVEFALAARLPAIYPSRAFVDDGGLMSYGFDDAELYRRVASDVAQLFKGATPADPMSSERTSTVPAIVPSLTQTP